ncbi:MAG: dihydrolipoyllysine-residue succinyltransferase [Saprospiraceae bacterium]|jgi:2-oxoglutarate dehydrogenase E2 component (dihydrolipoamide succinyltransferase)|nr:dihydrolipoyllysine-residue succinyltransferase [Saprospiraceae bacterium]
MAIIDIKVPSIGESVTEVSLSKWLKENGSMVKLDELLCEFESDKATFELPAEVSGKLIQMAKEGDDLSVGAIVAQIDTLDTGKSNVASEPKETQPQITHVVQNSPAPEIQKDIEIPSEASPSNPTIPPHITIEQQREIIASNPSVRREKMSRMRRTIAKHLVDAKNQTAMLTTFNEVEMSALISLRTKHNEWFLEKYGIKLGFMSLFAKACAQVLLEMPSVNAYIDGDDLVYHDYVDISVAISTPTGLVVPPIRNIESIKLHEFELALKELAEKAKNGKLSIQEMSGGTFTITNGGVFGSLLSTPIINIPQSAILGMHAIKDRPIALNGEVVIRPMMYLALSYDHRIIDGSTSVTFLVKLKELLEDPIRILLKQ